MSNYNATMIIVNLKELNDYLKILKEKYNGDNIPIEEIEKFKFKLELQYSD